MTHGCWEAACRTGNVGTSGWHCYLPIRPSLRILSSEALLQPEVTFGKRKRGICARRLREHQVKLLIKASWPRNSTPSKSKAISGAPRASATGVWEAENARGINATDFVSKREAKGRQSRRQGNGKTCEEREVHCQVEVVSWRERHISASICIEATPQRVWNVLTDYERLSEFIPNLVRSEIIPCPHPGRLWVLQHGMQTAMYWQIDARVILDLEEFRRSDEGGEIRFSMVDGDFKRYAGKWFLKRGSRPGTTLLHYEVNVTPKLLVPAAFIERIIRADLPVNLRAVADRAEADSRMMKIPAQQWKLDGLKKWRPWKGFRRVCTVGRPCSADEVHLRRFDDLLVHYFASSSFISYRCGSYVEETYGIADPRLQENGGVHRRVVAAITVQASIEDVWIVLTAYECLPQFIPNLSVSKILSEDRGRKRLLQEGCKCLLYVVLHARVVLDLWERPQYEIAFQQVEGDFESFSGSWTLEQLGNEHTLLKYAVEAKMHKDGRLAEAIVEEVIYEDLPANLCAIRDRVELHGKQAIQTMDDIVTQRALRNASADQVHPNSRDRPNVIGSGKGTPKRRPSVPGLQRSYEVLQRELANFITEHGKPGIMPMRYELRKHGRVDLEKAIARMGGSAKVAEQMKLSLAYKQRKPKGYWDELENISREILLFQDECGMDSKVMPTRRSLEKAGRYDLARAFEKWGGLQEVASHLGLHVKWAKARLQEQLLPSDVSSQVTLSSPIGSSETVVDMPVKTALPLKSTKWLTIHRD